MNKSTKTDQLKAKVIALLRQYLNDDLDEITSGIETGIYDEEDNVENQANIKNHLKMLKKFEKATPSVYIYVKGGNIQGASANTSMNLNIYDHDNLQADEKRYIEENGTPDEWEEMIQTKTKANEIKPIY